MFRDGAEVLAPVAVEEVPVEHDGAFGDGLALVRDDQVRIELHLDPEPVALLAGAEGAVEGEHPGLKFLERNSAYRAGHERRAGLFPAILADGDDEPFGLCKGVLDRLNEPRPLVDAQSVDDHIDVVLAVALEGDLLARPSDLAVDPDPGVAFPVEVLEDLLVGTLLLPDDRGEDGDRPGHRRGDVVGYLLRRLGLDGDMVFRAERRPYPGEEEPEVVVDLGDRADGAPGVFGCRLLFDGYGGREPVDAVDVRFPHQAEELPRVGGERLHVAPLAFGVDGVEGQRGFSRPGDAGEDDEPIAREFDGDVLEVVLPRPLDDDLLHSYVQISLSSYFIAVCRRQHLNKMMETSPGCRRF
ncbi:hypothetical protein DSECCO2_496600 [anaerobic digester metagenome]